MTVRTGDITYQGVHTFSAGVILGDSVLTDEGSMRYNSGGFQGHTASGWEDLGASPVGLNQQLQFNNGGAFGGADLFYSPAGPAIAFNGLTSADARLKFNAAITSGVPGFEVRKGDDSEFAGLVVKRLTLRQEGSDGIDISGTSTGVVQFGRGLGGGIPTWLQFGSASVKTTLRLVFDNNGVVGEGQFWAGDGTQHGLVGAAGYNLYYSIGDVRAADIVAGGVDQIVLRNAAKTQSPMLQFGGNSSNYPGLRNYVNFFGPDNGLQVRLADDSGDTWITANVFYSSPSFAYYFDDSGEAVFASLFVDTIEATGTLQVSGDLEHDGSNVGFFGTTPATKPAVTGSRGGNVALASLLTALAGLGLVTDSTT